MQTGSPGGIYCQHRPKSRRINDPAIKVVIVADRYGECDRLSSIKSDHSVLNQRDPLLRISKLQDPVMVEIKGIGRKYFREFNGIRLFPFRQKEGHPVSSAAVGRGICRTGKNYSSRQWKDSAYSGRNPVFLPESKEHPDKIPSRIPEIVPVTFSDHSRREPKCRLPPGSYSDYIYYRNDTVQEKTGMNTGRRYIRQHIFYNRRHQLFPPPTQKKYTGGQKKQGSREQKSRGDLPRSASAVRVGEAGSFPSAIAEEAKSFVAVWVGESGSFSPAVAEDSESLAAVRVGGIGILPVCRSRGLGILSGGQSRGNQDSSVCRSRGLGILSGSPGRGIRILFGCLCRGSRILRGCHGVGSGMINRKGSGFCCIIIVGNRDFYAAFVTEI